MNVRRRMRLLAVTTAVVVPPVFAQSSVTLFGVPDMAARFTINGDRSVKSLASGGYNGSRWGVRGTEDMGDGLQAGFWLEAGVVADTGAQADSTRMFDRRSTVSLLGSLGELRLGRDTTPTYAGVLDFDVFGDSGVAASGKFFNKLGMAADTVKRADNQASYVLPARWGGLYGQASLAAGEGSTGKKYGGGRIGYAAGPMNLSVAVGQTTVVPLSGGSDQYKVLAMGGSFDFGSVKLLGYYDERKFAAQALKTYILGASVAIGKGVLRAGYTAVNAVGTDAQGASVAADDAYQLALGYTYSLSKRTVVYATAARIDNQARAAYVVDSNPALPSPNTGKDSTGYEIGLRYSF